MENKESKYIVIKSNDLARSLVFITGERYFVYDSVTAPEKKVYSFKNSDRLQNALKILNDARKELYI